LLDGLLAGSIVGSAVGDELGLVLVLALGEIDGNTEGLEDGTVVTEHLVSRMAIGLARLMVVDLELKMAPVMVYQMVYSLVQVS